MKITDDNYKGISLEDFVDFDLEELYLLEEVLDAAEQLEKETEILYSWGCGDSLDRERVRDILLQNYNFQWTK